MCNDPKSFQFVPRQFKEYDSVTDKVRCWNGHGGSEELIEWKHATKENPRLKPNKPNM